MNFQFTNFRKKVIIFILLLVIAGGGIWFYQDHKQTQTNVRKIETILNAQGFKNFYEKRENKFYVSENVIDDMLWVLENNDVDVRKIKKIESKNNQTGILIK